MMSATAFPMHHTGQGFTTVSHMMVPPTAPPAHIQNPLTSFLKGQPKALGTVQIMIGIMTILFAIVMAVTSRTPYIYSGVFFWGSIIHISAGALSVAAENNLNSCLVKTSLAMNIFSALAALAAIVLLSADIYLIVQVYGFFAYGSPAYNHYEEFQKLIFSAYGNYKTYIANNAVLHAAMDNLVGNKAALLVFSVVEMIISIFISAFSCKATCSTKPMVAYRAGVNIP